MVGGRVVSIRRSVNKITVFVRGVGGDKHKTLRVDTEFAGEIPTGSQIWWQARHLFVRPPGAKTETDIGRVGYAY